MKKLIYILTFISFFVNLFKKSRRLRHSLMISYAVLIVLFGPNVVIASSQADGFIPEHHTRRRSDSGFFKSNLNNKSTDNGSSGGNGDDETGTLSCPKTKSVQQTEEYLYDIDKEINELEQLTDSDSEIDSETDKLKFKVDFEYELDKNNKPILIVPMKNGSFRRVEFDQTRDTWYHKDVFPNISTPDGYNHKIVKTLNYRDRLAYLRRNVPDNKVIEMQNEIAKSLSYPKILSVPGFLGKRKIEVIIDINKKSGVVSVTNAVTNKHRTIVKMDEQEIRDLAKRGFHIFPTR